MFPRNWSMERKPSSRERCCKLQNWSEFDHETVQSMNCRHPKGCEMRCRPKLLWFQVCEFLYNDSHSERYIHLLNMKYIHFWWRVHCYASLPLDTTLTGWSRVIFCPRNPKERDFYGFLVGGKPPTWTPTRHLRNRSCFFTPWSAKSQLPEGPNFWAQNAGLIFPSKYTTKNLGSSCFQALIGRIFCPHGSFMCSWTKFQVRNSRKFQCPMGSPLRPLASKIPHHRSKQGHFFQMCLGNFPLVRKTIWKLSLSPAQVGGSLWD